MQTRITNAKKILSFMLVFVLIFSMSITAFAKTSSEEITAPSDTDEVFTVSIGNENVSYSWADINGKGKFSTITNSYGAKVDGEQTTQSWTGVLLSDIIADVQTKLGVTLDDDYIIKAVAVDDYTVSFTVADVKDAGNNYIVAPNPVRNFEDEDDVTYDNSYVRILRGDTNTLSNQANIRCLTGITIVDSGGSAINTENDKKPISDIVKLPSTENDAVLNSMFYIAVKPVGSSDLLYYYFSLDELKDNYGQTNYAFNYDDHTVDKTVLCNGVFITDLLDSLADADGVLLSENGKLTDDMKIQIIEEDGFHSNYSGKASGFVDAISYARTTTVPILAWEVKETYTVETEYNKSWDDYRWADSYAEYMRIYRNTGAANSAVCKMVMGVVVSEDGDIYNKESKGSYKITMTSSTNKGVEILDSRTVGGVLKGMKIHVQAPEVKNAKISSTDSKRKLITIGDKDQTVNFIYDEDLYLVVKAGGKNYEYTMSDLMTMNGQTQIPENLAYVEALVEKGDALIVDDNKADKDSGALSTQAPARNLYIDQRSVAGNTNPYGYGNLILYRYFGVPLKDILVNAGITDIDRITVNGIDLNTKKLDDYFIAYKNTQSKATPNNPPEGKRICEVYTSPVLLSSYNGAVICNKLKEVSISNDARKNGSKYFADLSGCSWADSSIGYLYEMGVVNGTGNNKYSPLNKITRADFMLMLCNAFDLTADSYNNFSDVTKDKYYYNAVGITKALGIAHGTGTGFHPTKELTRQDAMVLLYRSLGIMGINISQSNDLSKFSDAGFVSDYAEEAVKALVGAGIINGNDNGTLNPTGNLSRAEMAVILYNTLIQLN